MLVNEQPLFPALGVVESKFFENEINCSFSLCRRHRFVRAKGDLFRGHRCTRGQKDRRYMYVPTVCYIKTNQKNLPAPAPGAILY